MPEAVNLGYAVTLEPRRAIEYFQSKGYKVSWNWHEVWQEAHARAFTAAKVARDDILQVLHDGISQALKEGQTEDWFIKHIAPKLKAKGWWGPQQTKDGQVIQRGSARRLRTIYRTNMMTAHSAARWREQEENADDRPYLIYEAVMDQSTRESHAAMNGKVFRFDDPIWDTHYPPNGWGCRCEVNSLSKDDLKDYGLQVGSSQGKLRTVQQQVAVNRQTGEIIYKPAVRFDAGAGRVVTPEPGWNYNPGKAKSTWDPGGQKPDALPGAGGPGVIAKALVIARSNKSWREARRPAITDADALRSPAPGLIEAGGRGKSEAVALGLLSAAVGVSESHRLRVVTTPVGPVEVRYERLRHVVEKRAAARERYGRYLVQTLEDPFEVWLTKYTDGKLRRRYIGLFDDNRGLLVIARENQDGYLFWNFIRERDSELDKQRVGALLYGKRKKK